MNKSCSSYRRRYEYLDSFILFIHSHQIFDAPQERVIYNKEVQTTAIETDSHTIDEDDIRERFLRERDIETERIARDKELEEESVQLEKEIEQEIRGWSLQFIYTSNRYRFPYFPELTEEERASILAAPEFLDFVEQSSKIVQRALNDGYDYIRDYTIGTESGA